MTMKWLAIAVLLAFSIPLHAKERIGVKIIQRQDSDTEYTYFVAGHSTENSNSNASCNGIASSVNCSASTRTTGFNTPARSGSYAVRGATFSLLLPDGRIAIVNCESKYAPKGDHVNRRSCRTPFVNNIQAEFSGDKAKLEWPVSLDGKKMESETYKIIAVLDKP